MTNEQAQELRTSIMTAPDALRIDLIQPLSLADLQQLLPIFFSSGVNAERDAAIRETIRARIDSLLVERSIAASDRAAKAAQRLTVTGVVLAVIQAAAAVIAIAQGCTPR